MCRYAQSCAFISVIELSRIPAYCPKLHRALIPVPPEAEQKHIVKKIKEVLPYVDISAPENCLYAASRTSSSDAAGLPRRIFP